MRTILKHFEPISIERKTVVHGQWGPEESWQPHLVVQGRIRQLSGAEVFTSRQDTPISTHRLYTFPADIRESDRIAYGGKIFNVLNVNNVQNRGRLMQVDCEVIGGA